MEVKDINMDSEINCNYSSISKIAYKYIKNLIVKCKFKGGDRLRLNALANEMKISITPIREALKQLEEDELIKVIPNRGAIVVSIFLKDVSEIYDIRSSLETLAIQLISNKVDSIFLEELYKVHEKDQKYLSTNDIASYQYYNQKFHELLIKKTGNDRLIKIMDRIRDHMSIVIFNNLSLEKVERTIKHSKEHLQIINALKSSDFTLAERLTKKHIINAKEEILNNFKELKKIN